MKKQFWLAALLCGEFCLAGWDLSAELSSQLRAFPAQPAYDTQQALDFSAAIRPKFVAQWENRRQTFEVEPFYRWDQADWKRTHFDLSNFSYVKAWDSFELRAGFRKVFWGVTESQHLVDIVNQTDFVEDFRGYTKLGQPMVNPALITEIGNFEFFVMPYFRERTFPGAAGHFRPASLVNTNAVTYQSPNGRWNPDLAFRWSNRMGPVDLGLSHFYGTNRLPTLIPQTSWSGTPEFAPFYPVIQQTGLDMQVTAGALLGKLEMLARGDQGYHQPYFASTVGAEYTFSQVFRTTLDVGVLLEYLYDSRGKAAQIAYEDDFFLGARLTLNDSGDLNFLAGGIFDRTTNNQVFILEASRRFGSAWKVGVKGGYFNINTTTDPLFAFYRDNYIQLEVSHFFIDSNNGARYARA